MCFLLRREEESNFFFLWGKQFDDFEDVVYDHPILGNMPFSRYFEEKKIAQKMIFGMFLTATGPNTD